MKARYVIHTVGPVWNGGDRNEDELLANCYRNSFALLQKYKLKSIAFPAISTGVYRFPLERAARIAIREMRAAMKANPMIEKVICACFGAEALKKYERVAAEETL